MHRLPETDRKVSRPIAAVSELSATVNNRAARPWMPGALPAGTNEGAWFPRPFESEGRALIVAYTRRQRSVLRPSTGWLSGCRICSGHCSIGTLPTGQYDADSGCPIVRFDDAFDRANKGSLCRYLRSRPGNQRLQAIGLRPLGERAGELLIGTPLLVRTRLGHYSEWARAGPGVPRVLVPRFVVGGFASCGNGAVVRTAFKLPTSGLTVHWGKIAMRRSIVFGLLALWVVTAGCRKADQGYQQDKKNVVLLRYKQGSESTEQREKGFLDTLAAEYPDINVMLSTEYAGTTQESSLDKAQQVLNKYGDKIDGIFAVCEPNGVGILRALENARLAGKVKFVTFDPGPRLVQAMQEDKIHGIVLQDPYRMGYEGVKTLARHLAGEQVEKYIDTGEYVATPENMNGKDENGVDIAQLLSPIQFTDDLKAQPAQKKYTFAVIPKGTTHEFWKSVHAGAEKAAAEAGNIEIIWKGPLNEADTSEQISIVQTFAARKVDGIVLAPNDSRSLVQAVQEAKEAGIPVVIFDSGLDAPEAYVSYVATNNYEGGAMAARQLAKAIGVDSAAR